MTETPTPSEEKKEETKANVELEYQKGIIDVVLRESKMLTLHPLIDYHPETGLTFGVVFKNPKPKHKNDFKAAVIIHEQVNLLDFEPSGLIVSLPIQLLSMRQRTFELSPNSKYDLLQMIRELQNGGEIEREPIFGVYQDCQKKISYYLFHSDSRWHIFLTCWTISTYCHHLFSPYPNLAAQGGRATGKSTMADLSEGLAWNPSAPASGLRAAPLFRKAESSRPTMIFDATKVDVKDPDIADVFEVVDRNGVVERCVGKNNVPRSFHPFCPKLIVTRYIVPFSDKTIVIRSEAPPDKATLKLYTQRRHEMNTDPTLRVLASNILRSVICNWQKILDAYSEIQQDDVLYGRRFEFWRPFLAVCKVYAPNDYEQLLTLAKENAQTSSKGDVLSDVEDTVIGILLDWKEAHSSTSKNVSFRLKDLTKHVQDALGNNVVRNYRPVQSAVENLHVTRKSYKQSDHITYEFDTDLVEKVANERGVGPPPTKEKEARCHECARLISKDEGRLTVNEHLYCSSCATAIGLGSKISGTSQSQPTEK